MNGQISLSYLLLVFGAIILVAIVGLSLKESMSSMASMPTYTFNGSYHMTYSTKITYKDPWQDPFYSKFSNGLKVTITNKDTIDISDFQVYLELHSSNFRSSNGFNFSGGISSFCNAVNNNDVLVVSENLDKNYYFWVEKCDPNKGIVKIWVRYEDNIPLGGNGIFYILWGSNDGPFNGYNDPKKVFVLYDDFEGTDLNTGIWNYHTYNCTKGVDCLKVENGILWLVSKSKYKGANIVAKNLKISPYDKYIIQVKFKIDYVCASSNDGDGMSISIGRPDNKLDAHGECQKGFNNYNDVLNVEIYDDKQNGNSGNGIGIDTDDYHDCKIYGAIYYESIKYKSSDLSDGIITIKLDGSKICVDYNDLNPSNGYYSFKDLCDNSIPNTGGNLFAIGAGAGWAGCYMCNPDSAHGLDWVFIRTYASQEPIITFK